MDVAGRRQSTAGHRHPARLLAGDAVLIIFFNYAQMVIECA
jgi:hypothetical protein